MKTAREREIAFRGDLKKLLDRHMAELEVTDDGESYGQHHGVCEITMRTVWNNDGNEIAEYTSFRL